MDLTQLTEAQFLCDGARDGDLDNPLAFSLLEMALENLPLAPVRTLNADYELHVVVGQPGDTVMLHKGEVVGGYLGESLALRDDHQRIGLSTALILAAVPYRPAPIKRTVSNLGEAALRKAWRVANGKAPNPWP